ncbi:FAD-dependent oxidoreductase, partial [Methylobacterium indicum]|uniref:FAD-dependent oxidoreductase n=1 Tax=Methylobacterium indicum TaxID=1775910 RepID=UPI001FCE24F5
MVTQAEVCVIGAGLSGLSAAKAFRRHGHRVTVLERGPNLGGVWEPSYCHPDVRTQTPKDNLRLLRPADAGRLPGMAVGRPSLHLSARLCRTVRPRPADPHRRSGKRADRGWDVTTTGADAAARMQAYDFAAFCTGRFSHENKPVHPGAEGFEASGGRILHSSEHTDADRSAADGCAARPPARSTSFPRVPSRAPGRAPSRSEKDGPRHPNARKPAGREP